jgi:hypothetical protein
MWSCSKLSFRRFCGHRRRGGRRLHRKDAVLPAPHLTESGPSRRPAPAANPSRGPGLPRLTESEIRGAGVSGRMSTAMEGVGKKRPRPRRASTPARQRQTHTHADRATPASPRQPPANTERQRATPPSPPTAASAHKPPLCAPLPILHTGPDPRPPLRGQGHRRTLMPGCAPPLLPGCAPPLPKRG